MANQMVEAKPSKGSLGLRSLNRYLEAYAGRDRPALYDVASEFPRFAELDRNWRVIREEVEGVLGRGADLPRYHDLDANQEAISAEERGGNWKVLPLNLMGEKPEATRRLCPRTAEMVDRTPDLFQAFFSILEPGKSIPAHRGPYLGYLRYHLALIVPEEDPPRMRIKDTGFTWEEGKSIVLDDSWGHEVINESSSIRVVLIVDFLRPLPRAPRLVNRLVSRHIIRRIYAKKLAENLRRFEPSLTAG